MLQRLKATREKIREEYLGEGEEADVLLKNENPLSARRPTYILKEYFVEIKTLAHERLKPVPFAFRVGSHLLHHRRFSPDAISTTFSSIITEGHSLRR